MRVLGRGVAGMEGGSRAGADAAAAPEAEAAAQAAPGPSVYVPAPQLEAPEEDLQLIDASGLTVMQAVEEEGDAAVMAGGVTAFSKNKERVHGMGERCCLLLLWRVGQEVGRKGYAACQTSCSVRDHPAVLASACASSLFGTALFGVCPLRPIYSLQSVLPANFAQASASWMSWRRRCGSWRRRRALVMQVRNGRGRHLFCCSDPACCTG